MLCRLGLPLILLLFRRALWMEGGGGGGESTSVASPEEGPSSPRWVTLTSCFGLSRLTVWIDLASKHELNCGECPSLLAEFQAA